MKSILFLFAVTTGLLFLTSECPAALRATAPRCEYLENPLGLDETEPRLSWRVEGGGAGQRQTAYRVLVATSEAKLKPGRADLWDSAKVSSGKTIQIAYQGKPLTSRQTCFWRVLVWDKDGKEGSWSPTGSWSMGLLQDSDWTAEYISFADKSPVWTNRDALYLPAARQYRKEFAAGRGIRRATLYATALGIYEVHLNGQRVGQEYFAPGWTDYNRRAYYRTYDVTRRIKSGDNAMGAWVADGWYAGYVGYGLLTGMGTERVGRAMYGKTPSFMAQLEIEYSDGSREIVNTDKSWKVTGDGPIQEADLLMGETYDARRETSGWTAAGFDDTSWENAVLARERGHVSATFYEFKNPAPDKSEPEVVGREVDLGFRRPELQAYPGVPVVPIEEIGTSEITSPSNGVHIFNLGQNIAGTVRLKVKGEAGTRIRLRFGEMLHPDGRLMTENLRRARATDYYILRGDPQGETYSPRFTFHGFQYVELAGFPGEPSKEAITGIVLHSDTPLASGFECSDPVVNRIFKNVVWTQRANFLDLPTDCPQRDERMGWTGDAQIYVRAATYNADVAAFYTKWLRELMESQRPSGVFPGYAPFPYQHYWDFGTAWADAGVICPWTIWRAYGDTRIIEDCWEPMSRFINWRRQTSRDYLGINHGNNWGDWLSMGETTPLDYIDTVYFAYSSRLMAEMAEAIGKQREAAELRDLSEKVKRAFNHEYVRSDGSLSVDTQTAYALALFMDLVPEELRQKTGARLAEKIREKASPENSGITTGFLGTRPLLPVLSSVGQHDLALELLQSRKYPSWGYEVEQGATTIWERWNSYTRENGFGGEQNAAMNSFAHYSFGAVCEWMFHQVAGIEWKTPGWNEFVLRPTPYRAGTEPKLEWVNAYYDSPHGRIASRWRVKGGEFWFEAIVPPNTTATVLLPASNAETVRIGRRAVKEAKGVRFVSADQNGAVYTVGPGKHQFSCKLR